MKQFLTRDELLDWLAFWEVNPWGSVRSDMRAAVQSLWNRGAGLETLQVAYPYTDQPVENEEDIDDFLQELKSRLENGSPTSTPEPQDNRIG